MAWLGPLLALASAVSWSCANVAIQGAARRLGAWAALVWAQLLGAAATAGIALWVDGPPPRPDASTALLVVLAGVVACAGYGGLFQALARGKVSVVTPIMSAWAVVAVAFAVVFEHERLGRLSTVGVVLVLIGNAVLSHSQSKTGARADDTAGAVTSVGSGRSAVAWALIAMLGFGCMFPMVDAVGESVGRLWAVALVWGVELAIGVPVLRLLGRLGPRPRNRAEWSSVARASLFEAAGFVAVSIALGRAPTSVVSPLSSLSTAGSVLLGVLLLRERMARWALVGAACASLGVVLVNL